MEWLDEFAGRVATVLAHQLRDSLEAAVKAELRNVVERAVAQETRRYLESVAPVDVLMNEMRDAIDPIFVEMTEWVERLANIANKQRAGARRGSRQNG
jgi:hypothetical protein